MEQQHPTLHRRLRCRRMRHASVSDMNCRMEQPLRINHPPPLNNNLMDTSIRLYRLQYHANPIIDAVHSITLSILPECGLSPLHHSRLSFRTPIPEAPLPLK